MCNLGPSFAIKPNNLRPSFPWSLANLGPPSVLKWYHLRPPLSLIEQSRETTVLQLVFGCKLLVHVEMFYEKTDNSSKGSDAAEATIHTTEAVNIGLQNME